MSVEIDRIASLHSLADRVGVQRVWRDVFGLENVVADPTLIAVLTALGYPASTESELTASLAKVDEELSLPPKLITTEVGRPTPLPVSLQSATLRGEDGVSRGITIEGGIPPIDQPGYYRLDLAGHSVTLAVCPSTFEDLERYPRRFWGSAIQIPSLRGARKQPFGNFGDLDNAVRLFAAEGADAVMINPVHALFPGYGVDYSPYSPSTRLFLNGAMGDIGMLGFDPLPDRDFDELIDWEGALPRHLEDMRSAFSKLTGAQRERILAESENMGPYLKRHAIFDALDAKFRKEGCNGWQHWPEAFQDPEGPEVAKFAVAARDEIEFHTFMQWVAFKSLNTVQSHAKQLGMEVGLIADLAVGVHTGGSDMWALRQFMLRGLTIGAPPDPFGPLGQNWLLSSFSPQGLRESGYAPWIEMIRTVFRYAGGVRIDHAFGLARLWVVPEGRSSADGAYLTYPLEDLMRLLMLEAHRARALVVAEDLGTKPIGFSDVLSSRRMLGMRVLLYERADDDGFIGRQDYDPASLSMTTTHDSPTIAGWWSGYDLEIAEKLKRFPVGLSFEQSESARAWDRGLLWSTMDHTTPRPDPEDVVPVVDAALTHIGGSNSLIAMVPMEDFLGVKEQPNLPGTVTEHPNWKRRMKLSVADALQTQDVRKRIAIMRGSRPKSGHVETKA